jgi:nucleoside-diphosphate-sugar epimerase
MSAQSVLVWGANGVSGIAAVHALLEQPSSKISKVIAVSRRPPQIPVDDDRLTFLSIDILKTSSDEMAEKIRAVGGDRISVAHHYTYIEKSDPREATDVNVLLLDRALEATWAAAGNNLKVFHLQTGYKWYGVHLGDMNKAARLPYVEDAPRCSDDPPNFYYHQVKGFGCQSG